MSDPRARRRIWGWWFFDWASQPFATLLLTFVFPIYFAEVATAHFAAEGAANPGAMAQQMWGYALAISGVAIALMAPILGAIADTSGRRMPWIVGFSLIYVLGAYGTGLLQPDGTGLTTVLICFGIGLIGLEFTTIFTNALMPTLAPREDLGRVSGSGFAFGYLGGLVALALMLGLFAESAATGLTLLGHAPALGLDPVQREGTRFAGTFTAIWYVVFMIPFFLWVREPRGPRQPVRIRAALGDLGRLLRGLPRRPSLMAWLIASMFSRDALNGLYAFAGVYAATVLGWPVIWSGVFGVLSAIAAALISWLGGRADRRLGPKPVIVGCTVVLIAVCTVAVGLTPASLFGVPLPQGAILGPMRLADLIFMLCGFFIGGFGGALQAASRTMMLRHTSAARATEAFGLYALSGKATAFLAPALIALVTGISGSQRIGISPLIVMFLLSLVLLSWVKHEGEPEQ